MGARIFKQDNPYNVFMSRVGDLAMLSVAWFIGCIPIFTIAVSSSAACEVARKLQEGTDTGIFRDFWAVYKRRFGTMMILTLVLAVLGGIAAVDLWYISQQSGDMASIYYGVTVGVLLIVAMAFAFVLPLAGRSKLSAWEQIRQSARLALMKPLVAFVIVALAALPIVLLATIPGAIMWVPLLWCIIGGGAIAWFDMMMVRRSFGLE